MTTAKATPATVTSLFSAVLMPPSTPARTRRAIRLNKFMPRASPTAHVARSVRGEYVDDAFECGFTISEASELHAQSPPPSGRDTRLAKRSLGSLPTISGDRSKQRPPDRRMHEKARI